MAVEGRRVTLGSGQQLEPDYLILATGSSYPFPAKRDEPDTETAKAQFRAAHQELRETIHPTSNEDIEAEIFDLGLGHLYRRYSTPSDD